VIEPPIGFSILRDASRSRTVRRTRLARVMALQAREQLVVGVAVRVVIVSA
jgi:hypothetical protein